MSAGTFFLREQQHHSRKMTTIVLELETAAEVATAVSRVSQAAVWVLN